MRNPGQTVRASDHTVAVTTRLDADDAARLGGVARERGISRSALLAGLIRAELAKHPTPDERTPAR